MIKLFRASVKLFKLSLQKQIFTTIEDLLIGKKGILKQQLKTIQWQFK
jgi:hypothetical protein